MPYIDQAEARQERAASRGITDAGISMKVKASELLAHFKAGANLGLFDNSLASATSISELMQARGYTLMPMSESWYWVKLFNKK